jgi:hypothetical protein
MPDSLDVTDYEPCQSGNQRLDHDNDKRRKVQRGTMDICGVPAIPEAQTRRSERENKNEGSCHETSCGSDGETEENVWKNH